MKGVIDWIKHNKLTFVLLLVIGWLVFDPINSFFGMRYSSMPTSYQYDKYAAPSYEAGGLGSASMDRAVSSIIPPSPDEAPPSDSTDRLVIRDTSLSLQVNNVSQTLSKIEDTAADLGGFLVSSYLNRPENAASGNITIRVPEEKRQQALETFRGLAIKVVSESVSGRDVTDQYEDIAAKLATLNATKAKFETILDRAEEIQDILEVQRQIISLQSQIDSLKGRQEYLERSASLTKITIYLATDELALPYAPDQAWRPEVIFKEAVRSFIKTIRGIGTMAIWLVVYSPVWLSALGVHWLYRRRQRTKLNQVE